MMKRSFDLLAALTALVILSPLLAVVAVLVRIDSPGPVLFKQVRVGRRFRPFHVYKFRTMVQRAGSQGGVLTVAGDARVTRIGRVLRRYKLDELPQLLNIIKGEMSVVGPRPEVPRYVDMFRSDYEHILTTRPGLTDLASLKFIDESRVLGGTEKAEVQYINTILPEKIELGKLYVKHKSLAFDLVLIIQTLLSLLGITVPVCQLPGFQPAGTISYPFGGRLWQLMVKWRRPLVVSLDIGLIVVANYLAFWLRFDGNIPAAEETMFINTLPWLILVRGSVFFAFKLNEGLWRYTGIWDLQRIVVGVSCSTVVFYALVRVAFGLSAYPRSIFITDSILLVGFMAGVRLPRRILREAVIYRPKKRVLIIGAGDTGERVVREMKGHSATHYQPIGLIDDNRNLRYQRIHGVKVLGSRKELPKVVREQKPQEVILAMPSASPQVMREVIAALEPFKVAIKTVPGLSEFLRDRSAVSQIRTIALEDLLPRATVDLHVDALKEMVRGKDVLITGAGGSIGSELCRQIVALAPRGVILYERHENSLYTVAKELSDQGCGSITHPVIGDVTDARRLASVLEHFRPAILFHAAAHKHVPLVELNPAEALKNNCLGTLITAKAAERYGVERFVLISTDKAVNPSSVMGATKRVAELAVQEIAQHSHTCFVTVRFGNVLGSNGSVVLRFQEQIRRGGPVTVTHPSVRRYFMLIPEAVQLVLQAAAIGEQGGIYVLDMGDQIRVLDLARNVIRLSGYIPGSEMPIAFVGLRPGEKLYEELVGEGEEAELSPIDKVLRIRSERAASLSHIERQLRTLEEAELLNSPSWALDQLHRLVPTFRSSEGGHFIGKETASQGRDSFAAASRTANAALPL